MTTPSQWWICVCGKPLYNHPRVQGGYVCVRTVPIRGRVETVVAPFESETTEVKYDPEKGLRPVGDGT